MTPYTQEVEEALNHADAEIIEGIICADDCHHMEMRALAAELRRQSQELQRARAALDGWSEWIKVERDLARGCHIEGVCACCLDKINAYNRRLEQVALTQPAQKQGVDRG